LTNADVCIVGGGAIGVACAYELARRGASVTLLERGATLAWGCSAGNAGLLCPSHSAPLATFAALQQGLRWLFDPESPLVLRPRPVLAPWLARFALACTPGREQAATNLVRRLSVESLALHAELASSSLDYAFERRGILNVYETEAGFAAGRKEAARHAVSGLRLEVLTPPEAVKLEPTLAGSFAGAVFYPDEAHADPLRFVQELGRAAAACGADIRARTEVLGLRTSDRRIETVETTAGDVVAGEVILAAGAWTGRLARDVGVFVPVEGGKGYHVDMKSASGDPRLPVFLQEAHVNVTPFAGRIRLAGTLELAGLDLGVDLRRVDAIERAAARCVPTIGSGRGVLEVWRGLRPCPPDGLPILGRPYALDNLVLATGHAMMGFTLAPITGRLVADMVSRLPPAQDLSLLDPNRFRPLFRCRVRGRPARRVTRGER
jgi:D-amino-acid dehydrogenase